VTKLLANAAGTICLFLKGEIVQLTDPRLADFDEETRVVVSEPLGDLPGVWNPVPEASWGVVQPGPDELGTFRPTAPVAA